MRACDFVRFSRTFCFSSSPNRAKNYLLIFFCILLCFKSYPNLSSKLLEIIFFSKLCCPHQIQCKNTYLISHIIRKKTFRLYCLKNTESDNIRIKKKSSYRARFLDYYGD